MCVVRRKEEEQEETDPSLSPQTISRTHACLSACPWSCHHVYRTGVTPQSSSASVGQEEERELDTLSANAFRALLMLWERGGTALPSMRVRVCVFQPPNLTY